MPGCDAAALKLLDEASEMLDRIEEVTGLDWEEFASDYRNAYTLRMLIVELVEALAAAVVRLLRCRGVEPGEGYVQVFKRAAGRLLSESDAETLVRLARLRKPDSPSLLDGGRPSRLADRERVWNEKAARDTR